MNRVLNSSRSTELRDTVVSGDSTPVVGWRCAPKPPEPILLNRRDTARLLNISERSLFNYEKRGLFSPIRIGGQVMHRRQDIDAALDKLASVKA